MSTSGKSGPGGGSAKRFGDVLAQVAKAKRFFQKSKYGPLVNAWQAAVGDAIAARTTAVRIIQFGRTFRV